MGDWLQRLKERASVNARPYWTDMQFISNTPVVRAVILVPFLGWLVLSENVVAQIARLAATLEPNATALPWRVFTLYFGLWFVGLASFLYQAFCPQVLKRYASAADYIAAIGPHMSQFEEVRVNDALRFGDADSRRLLETIAAADVNNPLRLLVRTGQPEAEVDRQLDRRAQAAIRNSLQAHFDLCNRAWFPARVAAAALYACGLAVLAVPSLDVFVRVARVLVKKAVGL